MTPEFKALWIEALRSGKYEQCRGALRKGDTFCCLGVACDLIDKDGWEKNDMFGMGWKGTGCESTDLPFINSDEAISLSELNDTARLSFEEIADYIEDFVNGTLF